MDALIPFTTSGSLVDLVDKKVLVILRDGRKLLGVLRSYDQFANFLLESTIERLHFKQEFAERDLGVLLIRGENVVALGEIAILCLHVQALDAICRAKLTPQDLIREDQIPLRQIGVAEIMKKIADDNKRRERDHLIKGQVLRQLGFDREGREGDAY